MEKIFPMERRVRVESLEREVRLYDLSVEFLDRIEQNPELDTGRNILADASDLSAEEIGRLRLSEMRGLVAVVLDLTRDPAESGQKDDGVKKK